MKHQMVMLMFAGLVVSVGCKHGHAAEESYPTKPIRMVVGFGPGGAADILARIIGQRLTDSWGQPVIVDNRPGATTTIAADTVARSRGDGYTLLVITSAHAVSASMYKGLAYKPTESFTPITIIASAPLVLIASMSSPIKSVAELISAAKASPSKITFGSSGGASITHLAGELLKTQAGIDIMHVPYKAMSQLMGDILSGNIQLAFTSIPAGLAQIKSGRVRPIGVSSSKRARALADVPTIAEAGLPGYEVSNWYGVLAPAGVPPRVVEKLHAQIVQIVQTRETAEAISRQGAEPEVSSPEAFKVYLTAEVAKWEKVVRASGVRAN